MPWFLRVSGKGEGYRDEQDEGKHGHCDVEREQRHQHPPKAHDSLSLRSNGQFYSKVQGPLAIG